MLSRLTRLAILLGAIVWHPSAPLADSNIGGVTIISSDAQIESQTCFSFEVTARMEAPPKAVFEALTYPENHRKILRVIESPDHRSKILEFDLVFSHMEPPRDKYVTYQAQFSFDPEKLTVSGHNLNDRPIPWNEQYALSPFRNGTETILAYRTWQCIGERPGEKPRTAEDLARDQSEQLKWSLENIERPIRFQRGPAPAPQYRKMGGEFTQPPLRHRRHRSSEVRDYNSLRKGHFLEFGPSPAPEARPSIATPGT